MRFATSIVLLCAAASTAGADSKFEILDRGDAVEIIAHDIKAAKTTIAPIRSRLEVPIVGTNTIPKLIPSGDKTIKVVELDGRSSQVLSVKLDYEHPQVQQMAKYAQAIQVGNDLHMIVPRAVPTAGSTISLPEPTLPPEIAAKAAAIAPVVDVPKPEVKADVKPEPKVEAPKVEEKAAEVPATGLVIRKTEPAEAPKKTAPIAKAPQDGFKNMPLMLACVLALLGCVAWVKRRKNNAGTTKMPSTIEIVAQKSLGRNAKLVWINAGGREMIVSVTAQQVRMLGQWKKSETEGRTVRTPVRAEGSGRISQPILGERSTRISQIALPEATALPSLAEKSSAVSGLLKLRAKTNVPQINEDVATDDVDADAVWAREILAATGARR